jgi:hypothetical protein
MQMLTLWLTPGQMGDMMFLLLVALGVCALACFITIQIWLQSPQRHAFNEAWFAQFEAHVRQVYSEGAVGWRARDLNSHFDRSIIT